EDDHVDGPVQGDQAQNVPVTEYRPPGGQPDLLPGRDPFPDGMDREISRQPGVASEAAVPADTVVLTDDGEVGAAHGPSVRAHQGMALPPAGQQLVPVVRT